VIAYAEKRRRLLLAIDWYPQPARRIAKRAGLSRDDINGQQLGGILRTFVAAGLVQTAFDDYNRDVPDAYGQVRQCNVYWSTPARDLAARVLSGAP
jgi:hypothetical protein